MYQKIKVWVYRVLSFTAIIVTLLSWLGVPPPKDPKTFVDKMYQLLFLPISLFYILLVAALIFFIMSVWPKKRKETNLKSSKDTVPLTDEHYSFLVFLLQCDSSSCLEKKSKDSFLANFGKTVADFNIIKDELIEMGLIYTARNSVRGNALYLTSDGKKVAAGRYRADNGKTV